MLRGDFGPTFKGWLELAFSLGFFAFIGWTGGYGFIQSLVVVSVGFWLMVTVSKWSEMKARISRLETENDKLKTENDELKTENAGLTFAVEALREPQTVFESDDSVEDGK